MNTVLDLECLFSEVSVVSLNISIEGPKKCSLLVVPGIENTNLVEPLPTKCKPLSDPFTQILLDKGWFYEVKLQLSLIHSPLASVRCSLGLFTGGGISKMDQWFHCGGSGVIGS